MDLEMQRIRKQVGMMLGPKKDMSRLQNKDLRSKDEHDACGSKDLTISSSEIHVHPLIHPSISL